MSPALDDADSIGRLRRDGLVADVEGAVRTTRKFQSAMARAAAALYELGDPGDDLRVPLAYVLTEIYGEELSDVEIAALVEAMVPIESAELAPRRVPT